jgi:hypothetical protein
MSIVYRRIVVQVERRVRGIRGVKGARGVRGVRGVIGGGTRFVGVEDIAVVDAEDT